MDTLISIDGNHAVVVSHVRAIGTKDEQGNVKAKNELKHMDVYERIYDSNGSGDEFKRVRYSRSKILQLYNALEEAESGEPFETKLSDIDDDLPW